MLHQRYGANDIRTVYLYKDMTSRDLLQQRCTDAVGDTRWRHSHVIEAAVSGQLLVLDGVDRLESDTLASLHQLLDDRTLLGTY